MNKNRCKLTSPHLIKTPKCIITVYHNIALKEVTAITSSNQWLGSAGARLLRDARHKRHRSLHGSTCRMDSNATKARSTLRRVAEQLLILPNEGQLGHNFF